MKVTLLRHGTRDFGVGDSPLNFEGLEQAQQLSKDLSPTLLVASPKRRSQMTLEPLAKKLNLEILIDPLVDQRSSIESQLEFQHRVAISIKKIVSFAQSTESVVICSHSDWLTTALQTIDTDYLEASSWVFPCASYLNFKIERDLWIKI